MKQLEQVSEPDRLKYQTETYLGLRLLLLLASGPPPLTSKELFELRARAFLLATQSPPSGTGNL